MTEQPEQPCYYYLERRNSFWIFDYTKTSLDKDPKIDDFVGLKKCSAGEICLANRNIGSGGILTNPCPKRSGKYKISNLCKNIGRQS
jgi:hypothetical protein